MLGGLGEKEKVGGRMLPGEGEGMVGGARVEGGGGRHPRGRSELITRVHNEQVEVAQHHTVALLGKYFPLQPQIIATIWVSLPRVQILPVYLHELSTLHTW